MAEQKPKGYAIGRIAKRGVDENGQFDAIAFARELDRHGTIFEPMGADLRAYRDNPILLACHQPFFENGRAPAIGKTLHIEPTPTEMPFRGQFANAGLGPEYREMYRDGCMSMFSIRFDPETCKYRLTRTVVDGETRDAVLITAYEIREISAVAVGSNRKALLRAIDSGVGGRSAYDMYAQACVLRDIAEIAGADADADEVVAASPMREINLMASVIAEASIDGATRSARTASIERFSEEIQTAVERSLNGRFERLESRLADITDLILTTPDERQALARLDRGDSPLATGQEQILQEIRAMRG